MSALIILNYDVHDTAALDRYRDDATPVLLGEGAAVLVASTAETHSLPEAPAAGSRTVVLRAASVEAALALYHSEDYQRLVPARLAATTPRAAFVVPVLEEG